MCNVRIEDYIKDIEKLLAKEINEKKHKGIFNAKTKIYPNGSGGFNASVNIDQKNDSFTISGTVSVDGQKPMKNDPGSSQSHQADHSFDITGKLIRGEGHFKDDCKLDLTNPRIHVS